MQEDKGDVRTVGVWPGTFPLLPFRKRAFYAAGQLACLSLWRTVRTICIPKLHYAMLPQPRRCKTDTYCWNLGTVCLSATLCAADFTRTWKLNFAKSKDRPEVESQIMKIEQTGSNTYRNTIEAVLKSGEKRHEENQSDL
jgi:hypothetical protein